MTPRPARAALRAAFVLHVHGLERAADAAGPAAPDTYPPYDLLRVAGPGGGLRLVFALAGFAPEQLEILVAGDQITVSGEGTGDGNPGRFLHRGIAARRFRRAFRLAPGLDVVDAELDRGLLTIALTHRTDGCADDRVGRGIAIRSANRLAPRPGST